MQTIVTATGTQITLLHGLKHSFDDKPAVIYANGQLEWYQHGKRHRDPGPAVICDWYQAWYLNGLRHRVDAPAVIYNDGDNVWYLFGKRHRSGGLPAANYSDYKEYYEHGLLHRLTGPASVSPKFIGWCLRGKLHNESGPAITHLSPSGEIIKTEHWINGIHK